MVCSRSPSRWLYQSPRSTASPHHWGFPHVDMQSYAPRAVTLGCTVVLLLRKRNPFCHSAANPLSHGDALGGTSVAHGVP